MARDIEEFLKMAARRREQQKQKAGGAAARQRPATPPSPASPPPQKRRPPIQPASDSEIQVIGGNLGGQPDLSRQSVADHVRTHLDTSSLGEHAGHLGEEVGLADDKLNARLHETFDHDVGSLKLDAYESMPLDAAGEVNPVVSELREMLRNPKSIRQAVIISEVLKRPDFD